MSDEFHGLDAREKAALEAALKRCRALAGQIESILRNERRHFVDEVSLADFYACLERAAGVLGQTARQSAPAGKGRRRRAVSASDN
jgi:glutathione S-transferase